MEPVPTNCNEWDAILCDEYIVPIWGFRAALVDAFVDERP